MLELYHGATSVCSQKVRLVLSETGLEWQSRPIDLGKGEQFSPGYLRLNPNGVVPTLVHDGRVILESSVISEYLDRLAGGRLMAAAGAGEFDVRLWLLRCLAIHDAINTLTFATSARQAVLSTKTPEEIEAALAKMPNPQMAAKRRDLYARGTESDFVGGALFTLEQTFRDMSAALKQGGPWLYGPYCLADTVLLAYLDRIERLGLDGLWHGRHPGIADWIAAGQARPSYRAAIADFTDPSAAAAMRKGGERYWPSISARL